MIPMETRPAPLDALGQAGSGLAEFRVAEPREIVSMLRALCDGNVPVNLNASDGSVFTTTLWTIDADRGTIGFVADVADTRMQALLECEEAIVVGYLNNVKVQFEVGNLVLVRGSRAAVLSCAAPRQVFRFQRRNAFRVRPLMRSAPMARVSFDDAGTEHLLRVVDVSIGGCAVFLPDDVAPPAPGSRLERAEIDLDADTRFKVDMRLQHITAIHADARGVRLGFEFLRANGEALRALQRFIDQTQKRGKLMALD
jgi:c-di-GMP-binding flagellar brake protein YcgR